MAVLAGLQRIQYVLVYPETGDLVIAGPAGNWRPVVGQRFVITGVIATGASTIAAAEAVVTIFEAPAVASTVQDKVLLTFILLKNQIVSLIPLNLLVTGGKFVNGVTSTDDVHMKIMGYYIPA